LAKPTFYPNFLGKNMALDKSTQHLLRHNYKYSGYVTLVAALLTGLLFIWGPFHTNILAIASAFGFFAFLMDLLQVHIRIHITLITLYLFILLHIEVRNSFFPRGSQGYYLASIQFAVLTLVVWFALVFLFRKHLLKKLEQTAATTA
jgi:heme O synthase-like polyprenyltransferase